MKAVLVERPGGPDVLRIVDVPMPEPGAGEVRIRLEFIGVNFADVLARRATHRSMRPPPLICGCEGAGVVDACGPDVVHRQVGERVGVYTPFGGAYAQWVVVPADYALPLPATMSFEEGAAFTHIALTAHAALHADAPVVPGTTLLVTAAAGGLGGMLCELGAALGMRVIAAVGSAAKRRALLIRGLDTVVDYGAKALDDAVLATTHGRGADLVVEMVGGALFAQATRALAPLGRIVVAGAAGGESPVPDVGLLLDRCASLTTLNLSVLFAHRAPAMRAAWHTMIGFHVAGRLRVHVGGRFPLARAADAHRQLESRASIGKLLLMP